MVTVPVRDCVDVLPVALNVTVPLPLPLAPPVTVSQPVLLLTAVQLQPVPAFTVVVPVPPPATTLRLVGESENVQAGSGLVDREGLSADRQRAGTRLRRWDSPSRRSSTWRCRCRWPEPLMVSHEVALLTAVHEHPVGALRVMAPPPPAAVIDWLVGVSANVQVAAACETVKVCEAIVSVPVRVEAFGLAATLKPTVPSPLPLAPLVTVIQLLLLEADHGQPAGDVTFVDPVLPAAGADRLFDEMANVHPTPACVTVKVLAGNRQRAAALRRAGVRRRAEPDRAIAAAAGAARDRQP